MIHGIPNYGQTCYVNSVVQALASLDSFILYLEQLSELQSSQQSQSQSQSSNCNGNKLETNVHDTNTNTDTNVDSTDNVIDNNTIILNKSVSNSSENSEIMNPVVLTKNNKKTKQQLPATILLDLLHKVNGTTSTSTCTTYSSHNLLSTCSTSSSSSSTGNTNNDSNSNSNSSSSTPSSKKSTTDTDHTTTDTENVSVKTILKDNTPNQQIQSIQNMNTTGTITAQQQQQKQQQQQQQQSTIHPKNGERTSTEIHDKQYQTTNVQPIVSSSSTSSSTTDSSTSVTAATTSTSTITISNNVLLFKTVQWLYTNLYKSIILSVTSTRKPRLIGITNINDPYINILKWNKLFLSTTSTILQRYVVNISNTIRSIYSSSNNSIIDTRPLVRLVGNVHDQFRYNTFFQRNVGTTSNQQQQDAEEFLQSLLDILPVVSVSPNSNDHIDCDNSMLNSNQNPHCTHDTSLPPVSDSMSSTSVSSSSSPSIPTNKTTSRTTIPTNPFCGWIGNTIQCCTCLHTRRIRPLSFVDIPVVPTEVVQLSSCQTMYNSNNDNTVLMNMSSNNKRQSFFRRQVPSCTVDECLYDFISPECISDVHCRNCTIQTQKLLYQDDVWMLQGAIHAARKNNSNSNGTGQQQQQQNDTIATVQLDALQSDYNRAISIVNTLSQMSPDDDDDDKPLMIPLSIEENLYSSISSLHSTSSSNMLDTLEHNQHQQYKRVPLEKHTANKSLPIVQLPKILTLHIQRRYYDPISQSMIKSNQHVIFKEYWNVTPYCYTSTNISTTNSANSKRKSANTDPDTNATATTQFVQLYRLMSVIEHQGNASFGHYVCYRRNSSNNYINSSTTTTKPNPSPRLNSNNSWLRISDETVQQCSWLTVSQCQAYLLFYEQV